MSVTNYDPAVTDITQQQILLVSGDASIVRKFKLLLSPQYILHTTNSIAEGLELSHELHPNLILCDVLLQDATGYQFLISLRNDPVLKPTPIILFSRPNMPANMRKGMNLGADDYLVYPFSGEELLKSIHSRISRFHHIRDTPLLNKEKIKMKEVSTLDIDEKLSKTEAKILSMIARGMSSRDIASYKCVSVRTVDNHRHNITKKLHLSGPNSLVKFAIGYAGAISR
jgi:DNA-binding NarL/FixJ family response regulator